MYPLAYWFCMLMIYSFIGWAYESALCSITGGRLVNRGFLNGPLCPVYGFGALFVIFALGRVAGDLILFLSAAILTTSLEYVTSWLLETFFHAKWWDYSRYRFNLHGRVCLLGAVVFGSLSVLVLRVVHPWVSSWVDRLPVPALYLVSGGLFLVFCADLFFTVRHLLAMNGRLAEVQSALDSYKAQAELKASELREALAGRRDEGGRMTGELTERLRAAFAEAEARSQQKLESLRAETARRFEDSEWNTARVRMLQAARHWQDKRILNAFPRMKSTRYCEAFESLRNRYESYKSGHGKTGEK